MGRMAAQQASTSRLFRLVAIPNRIRAAKGQAIRFHDGASITSIPRADRKATAMAATMAASQPAPTSDPRMPANNAYRKAGVVTHIAIPAQEGTTYGGCDWNTGNISKA